MCVGFDDEYACTYVQGYMDVSMCMVLVMQRKVIIKSPPFLIWQTTNHPLPYECTHTSILTNTHIHLPPPRIHTSAASTTSTTTTTSPTKKTPGSKPLG